MRTSQPHSDTRELAATPRKRRRRGLNAGRLGAAVILLLCWANAGVAIPFSEYRNHVKEALSSFELFTQTEDGEVEAQRAANMATQIRSLRATLPRTQAVEWQGISFTADNSWLDDDLKKLEGMPFSNANRTPLLDEIRERLQALQERLDETDKGSGTSQVSKDEMKGRLVAILQRPEYGREVKQRSALDRVLRWVAELLNKLLPKGIQLSPGRARLLSTIAQIVVIALAAAAVVYCLWLAAPRLFRTRRSKKKVKAEARVVLGERLEPDQSGADLLAEAEALARAGDLRGAIRKGYIALLVELGDRKVISLAQYKTNRDYLRSVREIENLYGNMLKLTSSFELHWYGRAQANENDWTTFRAFYREVLRA